MNPKASEILENWQVRKKREQKTRFLEHMCRLYPEAKVETGGFCRNLTLGDVDNAELVLGAHYDTCAQLPFPNFLTPKNMLLYILYSLLICIPFFAVSWLVGWLVWRIVPDSAAGGFAVLLTYCIAFVAVFLLGKPNPHTANDNTSGVLTLVELYERMTPQQRERVALVFFDNEENGLLGSARFARVHKKAMKHKLLLNFDCVSDGDWLMLVLSKGARGYAEALRRAFVPGEGKQVLVERASNTFYPSDQTNFPCGVGVAAMRRKRGVGLYMNRIHTAKDTVMDERNIQCLVDGVIRYLEQTEQPNGGEKI